MDYFSLEIAYFITLASIFLLLLAIVDLVRREHVRGGNKVVWALVAIFVWLLGPVLYLWWGRESGGNARC